MNKLVFCVIITSLIFGCSLQKGRLAREVNPFVGTGFHGHTYPGATVPFGEFITKKEPLHNLI